MDDVAEAHASNTPDVILPAPGPIAPIGMPSDDTAQRVAREGGVGGEPADSEVLSVMGDVLAKAEAVVGVFERVAQLEGTAHHADTRVHAGDVTRANMPPEPASKREDLSESVHHKVCRGCRKRGEQGFLPYAPLTLFVQVHGGSVALEGIASRELDFFSGLIVKYISDALSEWTHGGNKGEVNLKLEVKANVQADAQPVAFQMHLAVSNIQPRKLSEPRIKVLIHTTFSGRARGLRRVMQAAPVAAATVGSCIPSKLPPTSKVIAEEWVAWNTSVAEYRNHVAKAAPVS